MRRSISGVAAIAATILSLNPDKGGLEIQKLIYQKNINLYSNVER